ncbi:hypothetical protein Fot_27683 [Forsythia ovata]|uniref:Uncharacterized protein n=1 Tax=Forsythia ovata TaxID=205694 RepID=A0ABD1TLW3_9LAMI
MGKKQKVAVPRSRNDFANLVRDLEEDGPISGKRGIASMGKVGEPTSSGLEASLSNSMEGTHLPEEQNQISSSVTETVGVQASGVPDATSDLMPRDGLEPVLDSDPLIPVVNDNSTGILPSSSEAHVCGDKNDCGEECEEEAPFILVGKNRNRQAKLKGRIHHKNQQQTGGNVASSSVAGLGSETGRKSRAFTKH